ncbi:MAG: protein kinase [Dactylosporangium sp.]|nr:protein kinase [Dactylosporangium sp.]NNJ61427.1 protein kinase [Dactylosporangium sp.]
MPIGTPPRRDPLSAARPDLAVAEHARVCLNPACRAPVGRSEAGLPGLTKGICPICETPYSFAPELSPDTVLKGRYDIVRCLGFGGVGWVYLARDRDMGQSWRVLKGPRNPDDPAVAGGFRTEFEVLLDLDHPNIVKIYDVVRPAHGADRSYLVMEYLDGGSLEELRSGSGPDGTAAAIPIPQALEYTLEILDAMEYLHTKGWLYCDLKPDNVMLSEGRIRLVDFGAARLASDRTTQPWGTPGFEAPEVDASHTTVRSDLYTVAGTLGALTLATSSGRWVSSFSARYADLRSVGLAPEYDPYLRLLARTRAPDPQARFASAAEMRQQAAGVLQQIRSGDHDVPRPHVSTMFSPPTRVFAPQPHPIAATELAAVVSRLPAPRTDPTDAAAGFLNSIGPVAAGELITLLAAAPAPTTEVVHQTIRARLALNDVTHAARLLASLPVPGTTDWRSRWHHGLVHLARGDLAAARSWFDQVYSLLPGEPAARLGYALACEVAGDRDLAAGHYAAVWAADPAAVSAAFGLARVRVGLDQRRAAATVLCSVPDTSTAALRARSCAVQVLLGAPGTVPDLADLVKAGSIAESLSHSLSGREWYLVEKLVMERALAWVQAHGTDAPPAAAGGRPERVLGTALDERALRLAAERVCRLLARHSLDQREREWFIDQANAVRPQTWF